MAKKYDNPFAPRSGYGANASANMINLAQAGTVVMAPDLANLASNTPYVSRNLIPILLEAPRFFRYANNSSGLIKSLKALIEKHARTIDGLTRTFNVEYADAPVGGSGEVISAVTNVTRAPSRPSFGCWELQGRSIQHFLEWWITYGLADENTKVPRIVADGLVKPEHYNQTFAGATVLFIEPDPTWQDVVSAYLCTNMQPTTTGDWSSRKDAAQIGQNLDLNIEFTALTDTSAGVKMYARDVLRSLNIGGLNPNESKLWTEGISADVAAANIGIKDQLESGAANRQVFG
jgi:hypothetical protein